MLYFKKSSLLLIAIIIVGAFFRFYKLDWGQGLFAHPDEYHIIISVNQLIFPSQMNPHFFNYGTLTIYPIYFTQQFLIFISSVFPQLDAIRYTLNPFLIGRFYSALFSTLTILLIYLISARFLPKKYALIAASLTTFTPGLIQQAHFLTPESALIFFILATLLSLLHFAEKNSLKWLILASICLGLALAVKVSSAILIAAIIMTVILKNRSFSYKLGQYLIFSLSAIILAFFMGAPFVFLDFSHFYSSFQYETGLAIGRLPVFYTRQFIDTVPILFQLQKIYPYALGPALLISGLAGFFLMIFLFFRDKKNFSGYLLITVSFLLLFIPTAFLFAKWTRFSSPAFPFFAIFAAFLLFKLSVLKFQTIRYTLYAILLFSTSFWALAFFSIYTRDDVRITADKWIRQNTLPNAVFLVEGGNTIDLPLKNFQRISLDFYNFESNPASFQQVTQTLQMSDYFIVESRRVFANHQRLPKLFPQTAQFYDDLFAEKLGFREIKTFSSFPLIPDEVAEETWSVFDHPVIRIFKKI